MKDDGISRVKSCRKKIPRRGNNVTEPQSGAGALCVQGTEGRPRVKLGFIRMHLSWSGWETVVAWAGVVAGEMERGGWT